MLGAILLIVLFLTLIPFATGQKRLSRWGRGWIVLGLLLCALTVVRALFISPSGWNYWPTVGYSAVGGFVVAVVAFIVAMVAKSLTLAIWRLFVPKRSKSA